MKVVKENIAEILTDASGINIEAQKVEVSQGDRGDFSYPCMQLTKKLEKNPRKIAEEIKEKIDLGDTDFLDKIEVAGPGYLNFFVNRSEFGETVEKTLSTDGMGVDKRDGKVLVEFSSPNVAKPMHIGHFRNNVLGDALQRIFRFVGYDVTSENYIGDWGTQYGKLVYAYKQFGDEEELEKNPMEHLFHLYVKFHKEMEQDEELEEQGRKWANRIENEEEEAYGLWKKFREISINYHKNDYERMGVNFDRWTGESTMLEETDNALEEGVEKGVIQRDNDGSYFVEFEDLPTTVLRKADGTTLYLSRDIANLKKRKSVEGFDYNFYVVGSEQSLHFKQLFEICERMGLDTDGCEHISYGLLSLEEGSMSSRKGRIVRLSEVIDKAVEKAEEKISSEKAMKNAEEIGIGALKYANLSVTKQKDIMFNWDEILTFEGDSGPYLQYSNTRAKSILRKSSETPELIGEFTDDEFKLVKKVSQFPETVEQAVKQREPTKIANYLSKLCEEFNTFYHNSPVLKADLEDKKRRLKVLEMFEKVSSKGMELIGITPIDEM